MSVLVGLILVEKSGIIGKTNRNVVFYMKKIFLIPALLALMLCMLTAWILQLCGVIA